MPEDRVEHQPWPARAAILLVAGIVLALLFDALLPESSGRQTEPFRFAGATAVAVGGLAFAYSLERLRWWWSVLFALGCGLVAAGIVYWNGGPEEWRLAALLLAIAVAAPLFQVMRDEGRWTLQKRPIHAHVWTNLVLWGVSWLFVLVTWLLANLMGELFALTGLDFLRDLLRHGWFNWSIVGGSLGLAIGVLRDRDNLLDVIQRVATIVLSLLTPVIAVGLGFFLLSLVFTGLGPLWETNQTTPILLACALVAFFFANGTMGISPAEEPRHLILRYGAVVLALVIAPLAFIALVSTSLRIGQHGFTPDRLWAATCVLAAAIYGVAYWAALALGRAAWPERVRQYNVWLGVGLCAFGILLATPIINFSAISTRDQVARLTSGRVSPDAFDWRALAFDLGPSGRKALESLARRGSSEAIRSAAGEALKYGDKWSAPAPGVRAQRRRMIAEARVLPNPVPLPPALRQSIEKLNFCAGPCTVMYNDGANEAFVIHRPLCVPSGGDREGDFAVVMEMPASGLCPTVVARFLRVGENWTDASQIAAARLDRRKRSQAVQEGWEKGQIEIREVTRRQAFIGDEPVGEPFD